MNRLYRWLCRKAWQNGFDVGVQAERDDMVRLSMAQRERWYFVESAGLAVVHQRVSRNRWNGWEIQ